MEIIKSVRIIFQLWRKLAWNSDKEVLLKTAVNNTQEANPYYYGNEDNSTSVEFGSI